MTTQDIIKAQCQLKGLTVSALEQKLGYANGSLKKAGSIKSDRLLEVARELEVSMEFLMGVDELSLNPIAQQDSELIGAIYYLIEHDSGFDDLIKDYYNLSSDDKYTVFQLITSLRLKNDIPAYVPDIKNELRKLSVEELNKLMIYIQAIIDTRNEISNK